MFMEVEIAMAIQESGEMYLETIYILSQSRPYVRSIDVAEYMNYSTVKCDMSSSSFYLGVVSMPLPGK